MVEVVVVDVDAGVDAIGVAAHVHARGDDAHNHEVGVIGVVQDEEAAIAAHTVDNTTTTTATTAMVEVVATTTTTSPTTSRVVTANPARSDSSRAVRRVPVPAHNASPLSPSLSL